MADEVDIANAYAEKHVSESIKNQLSKGVQKLKPIKECYYCGERFPKSDKARKTKLFCNGDHATQYEKQKERGRR